MLAKFLLECFLLSDIFNEEPFLSIKALSALISRCACARTVGYYLFGLFPEHEQYTLLYLAWNFYFSMRSNA